MVSSANSNNSLSGGCSGVPLTNSVNSSKLISLQLSSKALCLKQSFSNKSSTLDLQNVKTGLVYVKHLLLLKEHIFVALVEVLFIQRGMQMHKLKQSTVDIYLKRLLEKNHHIQYSKSSCNNIFYYLISPCCCLSFCHHLIVYYCYS